MLSRNTLVAQILSDTELNTQVTIITCSYIVTSTILEYSSISADDATILSTIKALATLMSNGKSIPVSVAYSISKAIDKISTARGILLGTGESTSITTSVLRFFTEKSYLSLANHKLYSCPQTALEIFMREPRTTASFMSERKNNSRRLQSDSSTVDFQSQSVRFDGGDGDIVIVSLSLSTISYHSLTPPNSTAEKVQLYSDSMHSYLNTITATVQNVHPIQYFNDPSSYNHIACEPRGMAYDIVGSCTNTSDIHLRCPGNDSRVLRYSCPGRQLIPTCVAWNGTDYVVNSACTVISYTAHNTTCQCSGSTNYDGSGTNNPQIDDLAASTDIIVYGFVETWSSAAYVTPNSFIYNKVCLSFK